MIIGIDGNEANRPDRAGVHMYAFELIKWIKNINNGDNKYIIFLRDNPIFDLPKEDSFFQYCVLPGKYNWILSKLTPRLLINKDRLNIFFSPSHYLPLIKNIPTVCTIHDLGYLNNSGQFRKLDYWQLKYWTAISISISKRIIAVSSSTSSEIMRHYPLCSNKVTVIPHGFDHDRFNSLISDNNVRRAKKKYGINGDYILIIGTLKPSKNIDGAIKAYRIISKKYKEIYLVVAGQKGWMFNDIFELVKNCELEDKVIFTDYLSENDKPSLISGAKLLLSPSHWEGFGMHVLEAMGCGVPVIVSNIPALKEVVGESGVFVNPKDYQDIAAGVFKILKMDRKRYNNMSLELKRRSLLFNWEETVNKTIKEFIKISR